MRLVILPLLLSLGACANFQTEGMAVLNEAVEKGKQVSDTALKGAAKAIDTYCGVAPDSVKAFLRDEINERTQKFDAELVCKAKPEV